MKAAFQIPLLVSLAAGSVLPRGRYGHNGSAIGENDFVYVDGLRLKDDNGLHYLTGNAALIYSLVLVLTMFKG
jgi:mannan endo-1,4-beta-mannosidase